MEVPSVEASVDVPSVDVTVDVSAADEVDGDGDVKNHAVVQLIAVCDRSRSKYSLPATSGKRRRLEPAKVTVKPPPPRH